MVLILGKRPYIRYRGTLGTGVDFKKMTIGCPRGSLVIGVDFGKMTIYSVFTGCPRGTLVTCVDFVEMPIY